MLPQIRGLGFRDLKAFNLAMLAKQGWRILTCFNSLLRKILKVWNPHCSFLEAGVNHLLLGEAFCRLVPSLNMVLDGGLAMGQALESGMINGYQFHDHLG